MNYSPISYKRVQTKLADNMKSINDFLENLSDISITLKILILNSFGVLLVSTLTAWVGLTYVENETEELSTAIFSREVKDVIGLMKYAHERVQRKEISLYEAQESVKRYILGAKSTKGTRNPLTSKLLDKESALTVWANDQNGVAVMNPIQEGDNLWDMRIKGRYVMRETWANVQKTKRLITEYWQFPNKKTELWWAYTEYYEPWGWIVGAGGQKAALYDKRIRALQVEFIAITILLMILTNVLTYFLIRQISDPIQASVDLAENIAQGDFSERLDYLFYDETGKLVEALNMMSDNLESKTEFADQIRKGNLEADFEVFSKNDTLGLALLAMRESLLENQKETKKRQRINEGLTRFDQILRMNSGDLQTLSDELILEIVREMKAVQGGLFFVKEEENQEKYLELVSCFAYDRKKYKVQKIRPREGLIGQAYMEKKYVYMTKVPDNYVNITSGLGKANPNCILLVPFILNNEVYGILELAAFQNYEAYEIEFLEKLGEHIASTYASIQNNERTKELLSVSQEQEQELRTREEEMRQNMEELQSTQEQMRRKEHAMNRVLDQSSKKENKLSKKLIKAQGNVIFYEHILDSISLPIVVTDPNLNPIFVNETMAKRFQMRREDLSKYTDYIRTELDKIKNDDKLKISRSEVKDRKGTIAGYVKIIWE